MKVNPLIHFGDDFCRCLTMSYRAMLMSLQPKVVSIFAMVCMVKLCLPVSHLDISDSLLWSLWAKSF